MAETVRRPSEPFLPLICKGKNRSHNRFKEPVIAKPQEYLSKQDILRVTKSLKQNICVEMLQEGNHRSFQRFFQVLSLEQEWRDEDCPTLPPALNDQPQKLQTMKTLLTKAEQAERAGSWSLVCEQFLSLGLFFSSLSDRWLRLHFLHACVDREQGHSSRAATEAHALLAETLLQQGEAEGALHHAECCLSQAEAGGWLDSCGLPLKTRAQQDLCEIFSGLADTPLTSKNYVRATVLLDQALNYATDSGNKEMIGGATYSLGLVHELNGDHSTAKKYLNTYMQICQELDDSSGLGKAYIAMAKSLESEGNIEEVVRSLRMLIDHSLNCLPCDLVDACLNLGTYYRNMGEMDQACEFFSRGYDEAEHLGDASVVLKAQVMLGQAKAQSMMGQFSSVSLSAPDCHPSLYRLNRWKSHRSWDKSLNNIDENNKI